MALADMCLTIEMETLATEYPHVINLSKPLQQRWGLKTCF